MGKRRKTAGDKGPSKGKDGSPGKGPRKRTISAAGSRSPSPAAAAEGAEGAAPAASGAAQAYDMGKTDVSPAAQKPQNKKKAAKAAKRGGKAAAAAATPRCYLCRELLSIFTGRASAAKRGKHVQNHDGPAMAAALRG